VNAPGRRHRRGALPIGVAGLAGIGVALVAVPLVAVVWRVPWSRLAAVLGDEVVVDALRLSLATSAGAAVISLVIGVPLALVVARTEIPGRSLIRAIVTLPVILPPVVGGAALLYAFGRRGIVGGPLYEATGILLPFSGWGVVLANTFIAMPFMVLTVESALRGLDPRPEAAARTLGASRWTVIRRVTLPLLRPALVAGFVLSWARALGEFGATVTFAGNLQGSTQTMPLAVFVALESDRDAALAISLLLVVLSLAILVGLRDRWLRSW